MNRALAFTLLALAVVLFVATWFTIPNGRQNVRVSSVDYPAKLLHYGMREKVRLCARRSPLSGCTYARLSRR